MHPELRSEFANRSSAVAPVEELRTGQSCDRNLGFLSGLLKLDPDHCPRWSPGLWRHGLDDIRIGGLPTLAADGGSSSRRANRRG